METVLNRLARWMVVFALMLACWPFGHRAHAANRTPGFSGKSASGHMEKAIYQSRFDWKGVTYGFVVGTRQIEGREAEQSRFVALITSADGKLVAACERKVLGEGLMDTSSMLLRCEGSLFGPAAAMAKFVFGPSMDEPFLTLWTSSRATAQHLALTTQTSAEASKLAMAKAE